MFKRGISKQALGALAALTKSDVLKSFYLAGGTGAALQIGHRLSFDLDFFSKEPFEAEELIAIFGQSTVELFEIEPAPGTLHCKIADTKVSFLHYPYPLLGEEAIFEGIRLASLLDIALMKITAIASRGSKKDFIDIWFLLKQLPLSKLLEQFGNKFPIAKLDPYHYLKSLTYFEDAERDPMPNMLLPCKWEKVKADIEKQVVKLVL